MFRATVVVLAALALLSPSVAKAADELSTSDQLDARRFVTAGPRPPRSSPPPPQGRRPGSPPPPTPRRGGSPPPARAPRTWGQRRAGIRRWASIPAARWPASGARR